MGPIDEKPNPFRERMSWLGKRLSWATRPVLSTQAGGAFSLFYL
jgi:hypothetical protein